jgi:hypothetical protein
MVYRRFLAILSPLVMALCLELFFYFKFNLVAIIFLAVLSAIILLISLKLLIAEKILARNFWGLAILPILFFLSITNYALILGFGLLRHLVIILFALILYAYLENLFLFFYRRAAYQVNSLENSAVFLNIIIFFLLILDLNALSVLLNPPLWALSLILIAALFIMLWQLWWILKIKDKLKLLYLMVIIIIVLEFFWALSFLPSNFYILTIILTIIYYFLTGILRAKLAGALDKKLLWRYALISGILILMILITSRWI